MTSDWLLGWQNLIYLLPFSVALLYLVLYAASGITFGEADLDAGADMGSGGVGGDADLTAGDVDADADLDADADGDVHSHAHHPVVGTPDHITGHADDANPQPGFLKSTLLWLGVGRVPLSILLMVLFITWGVIGFVTNQFSRPRVDVDWKVAMYSLPAAILGSLLITRLVVRSIDRWLPLDQTTARRRHDLLGFAGVAMYDITERFGMLSLRDDRGELFQVPCRVQPGGRTIAKNGRAVLVAYNARENLYEVMPEESVGVAADGQPHGT